jgi:hypothetical protein
MSTKTTRKQKYTYQKEEGGNKKEEGKGIATDGRTFLILDFGLHVVDGIAALHLKSNRLARQGLHKDLHLEARNSSNPKR